MQDKNMALVGSR